MGGPRAFTIDQQHQSKKRYFLANITRVLAMREVLPAIAFLEAKPNSINLLYRAISMNRSQTIEIQLGIIHSAIIRIASEKPEWFYTEGWLKEILISTPSNLKPEEGISSDKEQFKKLRAHDPFWDLSKD